METRLPRLDYTFKIMYDVNSTEPLPIESILDDLINSFIDQPDQIALPGKTPKAISGLKDKILIKALDKKQPVILRNEKSDCYINWITVDGYCLFGITDSLEKYHSLPAADVIGFFKLLISKLNIDYASVHITKSQTKLHELYKQNKKRTFFCSGLYWLNFFGPLEESKQGGKELVKNPFATDIEQLPSGLFIRVGNTPFDCMSPEGEQRLINATKAMPSI